MTLDVGTGPKASVNYVFVDYENVPEVDPALIGRKTVHLTLLLGARQTRLDAELAEKLIEHATSVQLVRLNSCGKNAVDFALAFYLGKAVNADPTAYFHIVSKDRGFDALIEHLRSRHIRAHRHEDYKCLTFSAQTKTPIIDDDLCSRVITHLQNNVNRPKRKKSLKSHLLTFCGKSATASLVDELIEKLRTTGHLAFGEKETVSYLFDAKN